MCECVCVCVSVCVSVCVCECCAKCSRTVVILFYNNSSIEHSIA